MEIVEVNNQFMYAWYSAIFLNSLCLGLFTLFNVLVKVSGDWNSWTNYKSIYQLQQIVKCIISLKHYRLTEKYFLQLLRVDKLNMSNRQAECSSEKCISFKTLKGSLPVVSEVRVGQNYFWLFKILKTLLKNVWRKNWNMGERECISTQSSSIFFLTVNRQK